MVVGVFWQVVAPQAEAGAHDAGKHGLADQELLRALARLVVIVDQPVVRRLEAVKFLHFAADGQRGEQYVVATVSGWGFLFEPLILGLAVAQRSLYISTVEGKELCMKGTSK